MLKKRSLLIKISGYLLAVAPILATNIGSFFMIGEPRLPEKLKSNK